MIFENKRPPCGYSRNIALHARINILNVAFIPIVFNQIAFLLWRYTATKKELDPDHSDPNRFLD
jgi:hypothetical protein